jgi:Bacterial Ig-like domain (group 2)
MSIPKRNLQVLSAFAVLALLAGAVSCTGFFVNPTLTTLTVGPATPTIQQGSTLQMAATGTYDDSSTKDLTGKVQWTSSDTTVLTINTSGVASGVATGSATITATSGTVSGSTSATVTLANLISIAVTPTNPAIRSGQTQQFMATGTVQGGGTFDITNSVTWASSSTTVAQITAAGLATAQTVTTSSTTNITATSGNITSPVIVLTVNP